ncbi:cellulose biosynthesis protein BcsD [Paraburkholderia dinghuensis]|uniref:Cellulose synthase n=1 Tax=Paraburkholderia dinghuensis TaxID=2305225 RepID=A0A3N6PGP2_9BURK|nr:cellulose biosynthesis protein BcsD [Paraburkholderia dinghuensis]RQG99499.1 cellulose synthase [Paraburkholderia dinghuensis]
MPTVVDALIEQHLSPQWRGLLHALAAEFEAQLDRDDLRQLMFCVGERFAAEQPLAACDSMADLADAFNARWAPIQWGRVELADEGTHLRIVHYGAPLHAFGGEALAWTPAFLQGCYQAWLDAMGAKQLTVVQAGIPDDGFAIEFHLVRATT